MSTTVHEVRASAESAPTGEEILERVRALVPRITAEAAETEKRTFYSPELHQTFLEAGMLHLTTPKKYGGLELGLDIFCKALIEVARGDGSTAWCYGLGAGKTIAVAGYWPEEVQEEIFGSGEPFICPGTWAAEGTAKRVEGGWRITGTFHYASGSPYGNYFWGHALAEDEKGTDGEPLLVQFLMPRDQWTRLDDWGTTLGVRGSGSHSVQIEDGFTPDRFVILGKDYMTFEPAESTGAKIHGNPMYRGRPNSWFSIELAAIGVGLAKGAQDAYGEVMQKKTPIPPYNSRAHDIDYQLWYGEAAGRVKVAENTFLGAVEYIQERSTAGDFSVQDDLLVTRLCIETISIAWDTIHRYYARTAGSSQMRAGTRMERIFRDAAQLMSHNGFVLEGDTSSRDITRSTFGVKAGPGQRSVLATD